MKQYLLAALYNAPTTMQLYYQNQTKMCIRDSTQPLANKLGKKEWCCMGAGFAAVVFGILFFQSLIHIWQHRRDHRHQVELQHLLLRRGLPPDQ